MTIDENSLARRAALHAALAEPVRLAIVDYLMLADASPSELQTQLSMPSNLMAHHLRTLETAGIVQRTKSEGDRRRTYLRLNHTVLDALAPVAARQAHRVIFVCTQNSARSQLAVAVWGGRSDVPAASAGTHPAPRVHRGAVATASRHGLTLQPQRPQQLDDVLSPGDLIIAVCDNAHEELPADLPRLHWSVPDPVRISTPEAFDKALDELISRIDRLAPNLQSA